MKQFIVLTAVLPILFVFVLQFSLEQVKHSRMTALEDAVHNFRLRAELYGEHDGDAAESLRSQIAGIYRVDPSEVVVELTIVPETGVSGEAPGSGGDTPWAGASARILYRIAVPVGRIMAGAGFFGIRDDENRGVLVLSGEIWDLHAVSGAPGPEEPGAGEPGTGDGQEPEVGEPGAGDGQKPGVGEPGAGDDQEPGAGGDQASREGASDADGSQEQEVGADDSAGNSALPPETGAGGPLPSAPAPPAAGGSTP
jgi:hypothetical protein